MQNRVAVVALTLLSAACNGSSEPGVVADLEDSKVAILAVAVATGGEGHGFFDNYITCPRRGVINYINTALGRQATFSGCDTGDGVVVDGDAEIRWVTGGDRSRISQITVAGNLRVRNEDGSESIVTELSVSGVSFSSPVEPSVSNLVVAPVRVTSAGRTFALDARAAPTVVFPTTGRSVDAIPNPSSSLDALTTVDTKAIAYGSAMRLARLLLDETLESQRGEHEHLLPCGRVHVVPEPSTQLVRLENTWTSCDLGGGIFVSGTFTQRWTSFDSRSGLLTMVVEGQLVLGGNVPRVALTQLEWSVAATSTAGGIRISGRLVAGASQRPFSFDLVTDD